LKAIPHHQQAIKVREWDHFEKAVDVITKSFFDYASVLRKSLVSIAFMLEVTLLVDNTQKV